MGNVLFWWSIVSTIIAIFTTIGGVILLCISIKQSVTAGNEKQRKKDQVKIWMQDANGVSQGLIRIIQDNLGKRYSSTNDMANAIWSLQASSFALYQSLYEERCVTEEEFKQLQHEFKEQIKQQQEDARKQQKMDQISASTSLSVSSSKK